MKVSLKATATIMLLMVAVNMFPQARPRKLVPCDNVTILNFPQYNIGAKPKWGVRCDCSSDIWIEPTIKPFQDQRDLRWVYQDYVCPKCRIRWRLKLYAETNKILEGRCPEKIKPTNSNERERVLTIHKTDTFKCYNYKEKEWNSGYKRIEVKKLNCGCPTLYVAVKDAQKTHHYELRSDSGWDFLSVPNVPQNEIPSFSHSEEEMRKKFGNNFLWEAP